MTIARRRHPGSRRWLVVGLVATLALPVAPSAWATWSQFHQGPARLGVSRETWLRPGNADRLQLLWSRPTGPSKEGINSSPVVAGGRVFVGSDDGRLYAFRAKGGRPLWSKPVGGAVRSSPAVANGVVYIGADDGFLQARRVKDGALLWQRYLGGRITAAPLIAEGRVYVGSRGGSFFALRAADGKAVWRRGTWSVWDGAAYRRGTVYVGSDQEKVFAFDADTGKRRWVRDVWGRVRSTPSVTKGTLYVGTDKGRLYALDRGTGHKKWNAEAVSPGNGFVRSSPAVAEGLVYVSVALTTSPMDGKVKAFSVRTGKLAWKAEMADFSTSSPAYVNGVVVAGSFDHRLYAFDASSGRQLWTSGWSYQGGLFSRGISGSPAVSGGRLYIGVRDGRLYALGVR